ncbi:MAG: ABC transporter permease [Alphaproteobacteria bacterium]|nr:ABC transporter permease [Alphaproteobacteria bacterium]
MQPSTLAPASAPSLPRVERMAFAARLGAALAVLAAVALAVPLLGLDPIEPTALRLAAPSLAHPLGTDHLGRDVLARLIWGAAPTLGLAAFGLAVTLAAGAASALVAGYTAGRAPAAVLDSIAQALLSFPPMWVPLVVLAVGGRSVAALAASVVLMIWPDVHWVLRGEVRRLSAEPFVESARALGFTTPGILAVEILPNLAGTLLWLGLLKFRVAIVMLATLGFLGLGSPPPAPTWGGMIADARDWFTDAWWLLAAPAGAIALSLVAAGLLARRVARATRRDTAIAV